MTAHFLTLPKLQLVVKKHLSYATVYLNLTNPSLDPISQTVKAVAETWPEFTNPKPKLGENERLSFHPIFQVRCRGCIDDLKSLKRFRELDYRWYRAEDTV